MRVAVIVTARASWSKLQTVCEALRANPEVDLQLVACASALLERYGKVVDVIRGQGFEVVAECWSTFEGANLVTGARETGALLTELGSVLQRVRPDLVAVCADRHEVLGAAQAAAYQHFRLAHLQGGERSGSVDDRVRDAITQLADVHLVCTPEAARRVRSMREGAEVHVVGCPSIDLALRAQQEPPVTEQELGGAGAFIHMDDPTFKFLVVLQHPVTTHAHEAYAEMATTLEACSGWQTIVLWPGQDAGAERASKAIREQQSRLRTVRNLPPTRFLRLLTQASCLVGNSSAGIREASALGVPVVNIGDRQRGRERAANVVDVPHDGDAIRAAIQQQISHGPYEPSALYGDGTSGQQIAEVIAHVGARDCAGSIR